MNTTSSNNELEVKLNNLTKSFLELKKIVIDLSIKVNSIYETVLKQQLENITKEIGKIHETRHEK